MALGLPQLLQWEKKVTNLVGLAQVDTKPVVPKQPINLAPFYSIQTEATGDDAQLSKMLYQRFISHSVKVYTSWLCCTTIPSLRLLISRFHEILNKQATPHLQAPPELLLFAYC